MKRILPRFWRALRLRCPACGGAKIVQGWFRLPLACPACGLPLERGPGYFLGAMLCNLVVAELLFILVLAALAVLTWPSPPWRLIWIGSVVGMVLAPIVTYPFSKTLWLALDLLDETGPPEGVEPGRPG